jgi:deoxyribonuclease IV
MNLGAHVSSAGGIENAVKAAKKYNINSIQMMPTAPMRWATEEIEQEDIERFVEELEGSGLEKILIHGIYLTNLAREDKRLFHLGKEGLRVYLDFAQRVADLIEKKNLKTEILGICFHPGSRKELSHEESIERIGEGINWVLDKVKGKQKLLIETTAGTGSNLGRSFTELKEMREQVKDKSRVGFVIDTQHMYAAGYDIVNDLEGVIEEMNKELGLENVKAIHINDSKMELGSNKDRHANLGEGEIGEKAIKELLHRKEFKDIPFILETPALKKGIDIEGEIESLKKLAK